MPAEDTPTLVVRAGDQSVRLRPGERCVIGRADSADLRVDERTVSRSHTAVSFTDGRGWIEDLGSRRGTYLNGDVITGRTEVTRPGTIHLAGPDGPEVTVEDPGTPPVDQTGAEPPSVVRRLRGAISEHRRLSAAAVIVVAAIGVVVITSITVCSPCGQPSARDQLVVATVDPSTGPALTGTAVVLDGELGLVAVPRFSEADEATSYTVQVPLDDGRLFDVAAVRIVEDEEVDIVQLVGTPVNPDLADRLDTYSRVGIGELGNTPDEVWTYSIDAEGLPAPTPVPASDSGDNSVSTDGEPRVAFAPVIDGSRLVGFGTSACTSADGSTSLRVVDASGVANAIDDAEQISETVGPAPVPSPELASFIPPPCTDD